MCGLDVTICENATKVCLWSVVIHRVIRKVLLRLNRLGRISHTEVTGDSDNMTKGTVVASEATKERMSASGSSGRMWNANSCSYLHY
jgi:hypothetical protein